MQILEDAQVMKSLMPIFPLLNKGVANAGGMLHKKKKFIER
jgi:23S rRNA maturation-related 3'-5' exoribonuclease YhaM